MAKTDVTGIARPTPSRVAIVPEGLHKFDERPQWDYYEGSREALVAAGFARDGHFPGDPGRHATRHAITDPEINDGRPVYLTVKKGAIGYRARVTVSREEHERRDASCQREFDARIAVRDAEQLKQKLALLPQSPSDVRAKLLSCYTAAQGLFLSETRMAERAGFHLNAESCEDLHRAMTDLLAAFKSAQFVVNRSARNDYIASLRADAAVGDEGLSKFLAGIRALGPLEGEAPDV